MAPLRYAAKFDPSLSLDFTPTPSTLAQSKERKGLNFAIWQPCNSSSIAKSRKKGDLEEPVEELPGLPDPPLHMDKEEERSTTRDLSAQSQSPVDHVPYHLIAGNITKSRLTHHVVPLVLLM